jgi:hypothetical protein
MTKKKFIEPDFSGLVLPPKTGKKIQPPAPGSITKPGTKAEARKAPAWMSKTPPADDTRAPAEAKTVTVTPADVEILPPEQGQEETTGSLALEPIDYPRGGPQTSPDIERQIAVLEAAIEQGESVPVIVKKYGISRRAVQTYLAEMREEIETNSQLMDIKLSQLFEGKLLEIVSAVDKSKLVKASVKDLAIAAGIFADKRKELLGPRSGGNNLHLRAVFRGEGAIEVRTGD